ncbi:pseudouridine synthase 1 isoform X2 [Arctopsyche grandis]
MAGVQSKYVKSNTRYNGRVKKRKWEENSRNNEEDQPVDKQACPVPFERIKKKKVAMLLSYSGADYYGMQRNPEMKTIEEELFKALLKTNYINEESYNQIQFIGFQRAARTDKGVSAVRQVVSLKMPNEVDLSVINQQLPPDIRVFGMKRVTKGFNSKEQCDARTYTYMLPTYAFENHCTVLEDHMAYRIPTDGISKINDVLKTYEGTKNFHNFTSKKEFLDPSCRRFIVKAECGEPFVSNGMEFAVIEIKGQSFMLHQIRKMVGVVLAIMRGYIDKDVINRALSQKQINLPMAPGLGLVLDQVHYDRYNVRYGGDGFHEVLTWDDVKAEVDEFKKNHIYPNIVNTEVKELPMAEWLTTLDFFTYKELERGRKDDVSENKTEDGSGNKTDVESENIIDNVSENKIDVESENKTDEVQNVEEKSNVSINDVVLEEMKEKV